MLVFFKFNPNLGLYVDLITFSIQFQTQVNLLRTGSTGSAFVSAKKPTVLMQCHRFSTSGGTARGVAMFEKMVSVIAKDEDAVWMFCN